MNLIVKSLFGSHLYGTNTENSDTDYKSIYLPSKEDCYLGKISKAISITTGQDNSKNNKNDVDDETFSLQYFMKLAVNGEMIALDLLHSPNNMILESSPIWKKLQQYRSMFYTKNLGGYLGYIRKQTSKYGVKGSRLKAIKDVLNYLKTKTGKLNDCWDKLPINEYCKFVENNKDTKRKHYEVCGKLFQDVITIDYAIEILEKFYNRYGERARQAEMNEGIDWKAVSHALRAGYQIIEIYKTGDLKFPLKKADFLREIKLGRFHYKNDNIQKILDDTLTEVELLANDSNYPEIVNVKNINKFILDCYIS